LVLCAKLLKNSVTTTWPHKERFGLALGTTPTWRFQGTKNKNVLQPSTNPTRFQEKVLSSNRHISLQHGRHTLTMGKESTPYPQILKTKKPPNRILLSNVHPHRIKLWHLQKGTAGNNEIIGTLATISRMDKGTVHHPHWPRQPTVLESVSKSQLKNSEMACRPTRVRLWNPTRSQENKYSSRRVIAPTRSRPRRKRQPTNYDATPSPFHQYDYNRRRALWRLKEGTHASDSWPPNSRSPRLR
jgi:hypothetical protein